MERREVTVYDLWSMGARLSSSDLGAAKAMREQSLSPTAAQRNYTRLAAEYIAPTSQGCHGDPGKQRTLH